MRSTSGRSLRVKKGEPYFEEKISSHTDCFAVNTQANGNNSKNVPYDAHTNGAKRSLKLQLNKKPGQREFIFFEVVLILRLKDTVSKLRSKEVFLFISAVFLHLLQQLVA